MLVCISVLMAVCVARLGCLQIGRGDDYAALLAGRLTDRTTLHAARGDILDRKGRILATDMACYSLEMDYRALLLSRLAAGGESAEAEAEELGEDALLRRWVSLQARRLGLQGDVEQKRAAILARVESTLDMAALVSGIEREQLDRTADGIILRVRRIRRRVGTTVAEQVRPHVLLENLSETAAVDLRSRFDDAIGIEIGPDVLRWYPYGELACHVIGRVARVTDRTLENDPNRDDPLRRYLPNERAGSGGAEQMCEQTLRPVRGWKFEDKLSDTTLIEPARRGEDVRLSIDIELESAITDLLAGQGVNGAVVVLDVATGEILASVSLPQYDLNYFNRDYAGLIADEVNFPLINRVIARTYPPGSTVKPLTALAGLCEREITLERRFDCRGHADNRRPRCWSRYGHGSIAVVEAIMDSCNSFFSRTAERLGGDRLARWFNLFGLGRVPGTGMPGEVAGNVPDSAWMREHYGRDFFTGEIRSMAIGQGTMLATPLQIACVTAAIARGGVLLGPTYVMDELREAHDLNLPVDFVAAAREGMARVVNDPASQTAYSHVEHHPADFAGKTGTAQIGGDREDMAWFTAFAPVRRPRIAMAMVMEYAGSGGANCVPVAEKIVELCRGMGYVPPIGDDGLEGSLTHAR